MIDTTINFTQGLDLTINAPDQGFQIIEAIFLPNNGAGGEVQAYSQLSLGDQLNTGIRGQLRRLREDDISPATYRAYLAIGARVAVSHH